MSPQPPDPLDFTNKYNTPLPPGSEGAYAVWAKRMGQDPVKGKYDYDLQGAFLQGSGPAASGHFTDAFKKPNHPTFSSESQYNGVDGYVGGKWTDKGYRPSVTNVQFHTQPGLASYFKTTEPGTALLPPAPTPTPTGANGNYRISDLTGKK